MSRKFLTKLLTAIFVVSSFTACFRIPAIVKKEQFIVVNETDKYLIGKIVFNWGAKNGKDSVEFRLQPNTNIITPVFEFTVREASTVLIYPGFTDHYWQVSFTCINLSDTTVLIRHELIGVNGVSINSFWSNISTDSKIDVYQMIIDENKLSLFEKDYSLLDRFPEFYK